MTPGLTHLTFTSAGRHVPLNVIARQLVGGTVAQLGWFFVGFGMLFVWIFAPAADLSALHFRGELATASGLVTAAEKTSFSEGGSDHSDGTPIYSTAYTYEVNGHEYSGVSYDVGHAESPGGVVTVEFRPGSPGRSRIEGMRAAPFGPFVLLVWIFPMVGFGMAGHRLRAGRRAVRLLRFGVLAHGVLDSKKATNTEINDQRVYRLTFLFETPDGAVHQVEARTHKPKKLEDDDAEPLVYDPADPDHATLLDHLPGRPMVDDDAGVVRLSQPVGTVMVMLVPVVSVAGNFGYALISIFG